MWSVVFFAYRDLAVGKSGISFVSGEPGDVLVSKTRHRARSFQHVLYL
jgi:hypothetical protein